MDALNQARLRSRLVRQFYDEAKFIGATIGPGGIWEHITNISKFPDIFKYIERSDQKNMRNKHTGGALGQKHLNSYKIKSAQMKS